MDNLLRWRAEHLAKYLWWVASGVKQYSPHPRG